MATQFARIQMRRGTSGQWSSANPVLAQGEFGVDLTERKFKIGDGSTAWNALDFSGASSEVQGDVGTPVDVSEPIAAPTGFDTVLFVQGDGGPVTISNIGAPAAGVGSRVTVVCVNNTNTVTLDNSGNILPNGGSIMLANGGVWVGTYNGVAWTETGRN